MKHLNYLLTTALFLTSGSMLAQTSEAGGELVALLPDGVTANISTERKPQKDKNLVVAGSPEKGYYAFFAATDSEHGEELWVTDGTAAGTHMVKDIVPGASTSNVSYLTRFNDKVVFSAYTDDYGIELWISDGTEEGTYMVKDVNEVGDSSPLGFTQVNETQFIFAAEDFESSTYGSTPQKWLWVSDGTEEGTERIYECQMSYPGRDNNAERWAPYVRVGRKVFFKADDLDGTMGAELWVTDGTREGTKFVKDINLEETALGTGDPAIDHMANFYNEKLFFKAWTTESGNEPWASDGTPEGTYQIYDSNPTFAESGNGNGGNLTFVGAEPYNGKFYFRSHDITIGDELACTNCELGDFKMFDILTTTPSIDFSSFPDPGVVFDGVYMFCANSGTDATIESNKGGELHYTDGEQVYLQSDLAPGVLCNWVKELTVVSGSLYWWNESTELPEYATKLFRIDNKEQFPVRVTNLFPDGDQIHSLRNLGGNLIFTTNNAAKQIYVYHYRKPDFDPETETDNLEPEYRTRAEMGVGVDNVAADSNASDMIYPNPASTSFNIKLAGNVDAVTIYDISGRVVLSCANVDGNRVDVSALVAGIYQVVVKADNGITYTSRLIKK